MFSVFQALSETETSLNERVQYPEVVKISKKRKQLIWTRQENTIYVSFLKINRQTFKNEKIRRKQKVFIKLAQFIKNRTSEQCRSHHQRMMISHKSITRIIKYLEINFERQRINEQEGRKMLVFMNQMNKGVQTEQRQIQNNQGNMENLDDQKKRFIVRRSLESSKYVVLVAKMKNHFFLEYFFTKGVYNYI